MESIKTVIIGFTWIFMILGGLYNIAKVIFGVMNDKNEENRKEEISKGNIIDNKNLEKIERKTKIYKVVSWIIAVIIVGAALYETFGSLKTEQYVEQINGEIEYLNKEVQEKDYKIRDARMDAGLTLLYIEKNMGKEYSDELKKYLKEDYSDEIKEWEEEIKK